MDNFSIKIDIFQLIYCNCNDFKGPINQNNFLKTIKSLICVPIP